MKNKIKFALIAILPSSVVLLLYITLVLLNILFGVTAFINLEGFLFLGIIIIIPYSIAIYVEYSKSEVDETENLSEYELNLIQEKDNIIKSLEIIIISFSLLFGLFTAIEFDLLIAGDASFISLRLIGAPFGVDFFMATFVFLQTQVFGKDAYLTEAELEVLTTGSKKSNKIKNMLKRLHLANFTRRGCYYSILIQISIIYPVVMGSVSI